MRTTETRLTLRERFDPRRFFRGEKPTPGPIVLSHRRIFILPNKRGLGLALLLSIQLLAAINYNNNLGFILTFLLASIALLGTVHGFRNLAGLHVRPGRAEPVFAGDSACFEIFLDNPSRLHRFALQIAHKNAAPMELDILSSASTQAKLRVKAQRRGWLDLPTLTVSSCFPLGLFRAWSPVNLKERALVYPKPANSRLPFPETTGENGLKQRNMDDFRGFQSYQPGDPLKRIHWKGVAKGQGVQVKEYRGEEHSELYLDLAHAPGLDVEARLSQLCRWVIDAEQAGRCYGLRLPGTEIPPGIGAPHSRRCLEALALFGT
ncbi:MAG TPA: DUF58 domain-containing protein [Methylococcaceae bacterium]|jgi:uncharacterized protein (DUF58 family)|nr:DUF58 domain-containing protein [Methylococcaceae bacterium]